ncbi:MAG: Rieske (2Fe-2S) protein [Alphaproteobacteria bacterium]|nr:Rieske (2Fe-2S) protein [Alphaproteobacteria bacterium]
MVRVDAGALLAEGEAVLVRVDDQTGVIVARDAQGYFARSAVCTHACCLVTLCDDDTCTGLLSALAACGPVGPSTSGRALCPCHGSEFDLATGAPQTGPATVDLPAYEVSVDGTDLVVDTARVVAVAARTAA